MPPDTPSTDAPAAPTRPRRRWVLLTLLLVLPLLLLAAALGAAALHVRRLAEQTPDLAALRDAQVPHPSVLLAADGQPLTSFRRAQQQPVPLDKVAPALVQALIATEDRRFHEHRGIDVRRTLSALLHTAGGDAQGGSTITQQLARNLFPRRIGRERSVDRKIKEIVTALRIEQVYDKRQILETYLNTAPFLYNVVGVEMAARTYFGKPAADLDTLESATLVGMLKGTSYYNPVRHPERARERRNIVLQQMVRHGVLAQSAYEALRDEPVRLNFKRPTDDLGVAPHFAAQVRRFLLDWAGKRDLDLYADGLVIETTLDRRLQQAATDAVQRQAQALQHVADVEWSARRSPVQAASTAPYTRHHAKVQPFAHFWRERPRLLGTFARESAPYRELRDQGMDDDAAVERLLADEAFLAELRRARTRLEAGFVALDPRTGEVKAWVGSRDFAQDQFDHVAQAERQPGSTFKPLAYGAALEAGMRMDHVYMDEPVQIPLPDGSFWEPTDMAGPTGRAMSLFEALVLSRNTVTAQLAQEIGAPAVARLARAAGIRHSPLDEVPSLALGTSPVTLLELASAYATIAALGEYRPPVLVRRIRDRHGTLLADFASAPERAMTAATAQNLIDMLRAVVEQGTGTAVRHTFGIKADVAGKTGTSQYNADGWFMLMHPQLVTGAWVGFNDQRVTLRSNHWGQGGHNAVLLVGDFFRQALKAELLDRKAAFPPPPAPLPPIPTPPPLGGDVQILAEHESAASGRRIMVVRDANGQIAVVDADALRAMRGRTPAPDPTAELQHGGP